MKKLYLSVLVLLFFATTVLYKLSTDDESIPDPVSSVSETNIPTLRQQEIFVDSQSEISPTTIVDVVQVDPAPVDLTDGVKNERTEALERELAEKYKDIGKRVQNVADAFEQDRRPISNRGSAI